MVGSQLMSTSVVLPRYWPLSTMIWMEKFMPSVQRQWGRVFMRLLKMRTGWKQNGNIGLSHIYEYWIKKMSSKCWLNKLWVLYCSQLLNDSAWENIFYFHCDMYEVSWVIGHLETLASDAIAVWQQPYEHDALSFHSCLVVVLFLIYWMIKPKVMLLIFVSS